MSMLLDDHQLTERVLRHVENGTTDVGTEVWREPVANYRSQERFEAEIARVLRRTPAAFCPSAALAEPGAYVAREAAGRPILAVRGEDGRVRAFHNVCRHRGMRVAADSGCAKAFVCGYHGWTYGLDGRLRHVPHEDGFPGLNKSQHGLVPVDAVERSGLVFITQEGAAGTALDDLPPLVAPDQSLYACNVTVTEANWKIALEGFIEGYHIRATHPQTFLPYGFDNLNVVECFGRHARVTYPFRRISKLAGTPPAERRVMGLVTFVYHLFPNVLVTVLSSHTNLVVLEPLDVARTRVVTYAMTNAGSGDAALAAAKRDAAFVGSTGAAEDRAVVAAIQRGLESDANDVFTFGHFESAIVHFHRNLDAALASRAEAPPPAASG
jgi:phenylpropionate dioxygenase-like ring-hydroxylating dioxygenase large terminal subunit